MTHWTHHRTDFEPLCRYCELPRGVHAAGGKCLFGSTQYAQGDNKYTHVIRQEPTPNETTPEDDKE